MASSYPTIRYGSSGQEVRRLQQALNREGYSLDVDGGFGKKTLAALMDYQRRVGMTPDGVAGSKTWASLGVQSAQDRLADLEKGYTPSRETQDAKRSWEELAANRPEDYTSPYTERMEELLRQMEGRGPFAYDPSRDDTFQRYARLYQRQGQTAMEDALGQAAGLTGGYDSTYAQQAGQQEYGRYMQELAALVPQLQQNAWDRYESQEQALLDQYKLLQGQDASAYAIEIGRKLKEAKTLLPYGQWGRWLQEEVEFSQSTAQNLMKIFEEYGARQVSLFGDAESQTLGNLPYTHALRLLALPADEREEFAREHHVEDLSSRELEKLLRERDEARAKAEAAERASADARTESDGLGKKLAAAQGFAQELQEQLTQAKRAAETARQELEDQKKNQKVPEETMAQLRADAAKNAEAALADKLQKAKDREKKASDRVVEMEKALELKRDQDRRRVEELEKQLALADPDTAVFKTWFAAIQQDFLRLREAESQVSGRDSEKGQKLRTAVRALLQQQEGVWA